MGKEYWKFGENLTWNQGRNVTRRSGERITFISLTIVEYLIKMSWNNIIYI